MAHPWDWYIYHLHLPIFYLLKTNHSCRVFISRSSILDPSWDLNSGLRLLWAPQRFESEFPDDENTTSLGIRKTQTHTATWQKNRGFAYITSKYQLYILYILMDGRKSYCFFLKIKTCNKVQTLVWFWRNTWVLFQDSKQGGLYILRFETTRREKDHVIHTTYLEPNWPLFLRFWPSILWVQSCKIRAVWVLSTTNFMFQIFVVDML